MAASRYGDTDLFFANSDTDTDTFIAALTKGVEVFEQLRSPKSPEQFRYGLSLPKGTTLRSDGQGGAEVVDSEGERVAFVPAPFATDAQGTDVPASMEVEGSAVLVSIRHRSMDVAYPILLDPELVYDAWYWHEGNTSGLGNWSWSETADYDDGTWCVDTCWGHGLYARSKGSNHWYGPSTWGQWAYTAPNSTAYISRAVFWTLFGNVHNCNTNHPHGYVGIYNVYSGTYNNLGVYSPPSFFATSYDTGWAGGNGTRRAIVGIGTGGSASQLACGHDFYVGGAAIYQDDPEDPSVSVSGMPGGWISDATPAFTINSNGSDPGLGVRKTTFTRNGSSTGGMERSVGCNGTAASRCPASRNEQFNVTHASFDEGKKKATITVEDATGRKGNHEWFVYVDRSNPDITLSGQLAVVTEEDEGEEQGNKEVEELSLPVYNLDIKATDIGTESNADHRMRSGVRKIEVLLDDVKKQEWEQACPASSCSMEKAYSLKLNNLSAGKHVLEVIATDWVGKKREREIEFEYIPATGMKDEYAMHYFPLPDGEGNEAEEEHPDRPELAVNVMNGNLVYREQDVDVEGYSVDLEVERYYNSLLPEAENTEWGDGWTLAQTPDLEPLDTGGSPAPDEAELLETSGAIEAGVELPVEAGAESFDPALQATLTKKESGGYELSDETGESATSVAFDETGQTEALLTEGQAKVDYAYEEGALAEIAVEDPASFGEGPLEVAADPAEPPAYASTFGTFGSGNGQLKSPVDVAVDAKGGTWVLDKGNSRIQKFNAKGEFVLQFGTAGSGNGQLSNPRSLAVDPEGDVWVADTGNYRIQEFNPQGQYLGKFGSQGSGDGQFAAPLGIAVDQEGDLWVVDPGNSRVQEFSPQGQFLRKFGSPGSGQGQFSVPFDLAVDPEGDVWVVDLFSSRPLQEFNPQGQFLREVSSTGTDEGELKNPVSVTIDAMGSLWVGEQGRRIQLFAKSGSYVSQFGSPGSGDGQFSVGEGTGMGIAPNDKGAIWVGDIGNHRVQKWETLTPYTDLAYASTFGTFGSSNGQLKSPADVAVDASGGTWVLDKGNSRIQKFGAKGEFVLQFGSAGSANGQLTNPRSLAIDPEGDVWVADAGNQRIQEFDPEGQYLGKFGSQGSGNGQFAAPVGVAIDPEGDVWVVDPGNNRVQEFSPQGQFLRKFGSPGSGQGQFSVPFDLAIDPEGDVWVVDFFSAHPLQEFSAQGQFLREVSSQGTDDGELKNPTSIATDAMGNLWVGEQGRRVQLFDEAGSYVAQAGSSGSGEGQFAAGEGAWMGIAANQTGGIWVADAGNNRVQKLAAGHYTPLAEEEPPSHGDPTVAVEVDENLIQSVEGEEAGEHVYEHAGELLVSHEGPEGETEYDYDEDGRLTKVTLPNGTWGEIEYGSTDGRVKSVTVDPAGSAPEKTTTFSYIDQPRSTKVTLPDAPAITYDIGNDGSVFKWQNALKPPEFEVVAGTLYDVESRETAAPIAVGEYNLVIHAYSEEGIASIHIYANGDQLISEKTCEKGPEADCKKLPDEWVTYTGNHAPGILNLEMVIEDHIGQVASKRFWVNIPYTPPPPPDQPVTPKFADVLKFREEHGLDIDLDPVQDELEINDRVFDTINDWIKGEPVAVASMERWGAPLRTPEVAELEYREHYMSRDLPKIENWARVNFSGTYAGVYVDERSGGLMRIGFTANQGPSVSATQQEAGLVASHRVASFTFKPAYSLGALEGVEDEVHSSAALLPVDLIVSFGSDIQSNHVVVGATDLVEANAYLKELLSQHAAVNVVFEEGPPEELAVRKKISGPILAGDFLLTPSESVCSAGYGAIQQLSNGKKVKFLLTAAHCSGVGQNMRRENAAGDRVSIGVTKRSGRVLALKEYSADGEAIALKGTLDAPRWINVGKRQPVAVKSVIPMPAPKTQLCHSGYKTDAVLCGEVRKGKWYYDKVVKGRRTILFCFEAKIGKGDSGGPVWIRGSNTAVGLATNGRASLGNETFRETCATPLLPGDLPSDVALLTNAQMKSIRIAYAP